MKQFSSALNALAVLMLAVLAAGCTNVQQKENLAAAAGFVSITPSTPDQVSILNSLPRGKVTPVDYQGKKYYVLPDASHLSPFLDPAALAARFTAAAARAR